MKHSLRYSHLIAAFLFVICLSSCATVPAESVNLSEQLENRVAREHQSYLNLLTKQSNDQREAIDKWITTTYTPKLIANVKVAAGARTLDETAIAAIVSAVVVTRDQMQVAFEKNRALLFEAVRTDQAETIQALKQQTAFLRSMVSVEEARSDLTKSANELTGGSLKIDEWQSIVEKWIEDAAAGADKIQALDESLGELLNKK